MKKNLTEMVFILDRSGSMSGLEADTIGGFNGMIERQKKEEGEALVSTVLFSDESKVIHDRVALEKIEPLTDKQYYVSGCTALTLRSLQSSDLELGRTSASRTFRGRYRAIAEVREMLTMKLLRPHSSLSVCSTSDLSPTLVTASTMKREAWFMGQRVCPPMNSRMMEVGGMAAIS